MCRKTRLRSLQLSRGDDSGLDEASGHGDGEN